MKKDDYVIKRDLYVLIRGEFYTRELTDYRFFKYFDMSREKIEEVEEVDPMGSVSGEWITLPVREYKVQKHKSYYVAFEQNSENEKRVEAYFAIKERLGL